MIIEIFKVYKLHWRLHTALINVTKNTYGDRHLEEHDSLPRANYITFHKRICDGIRQTRGEHRIEELIRRYVSE